MSPNRDDLPVIWEFGLINVLIVINRLFLLLL